MNQPCAFAYGRVMDRVRLFKKTASASPCLAALLLIYSWTTALARETPEPSKPAAPAPAPLPDAKPPWGRIVVVGASASAGFVGSEPLGGPQTPKHRLSRYLDAALLVPHEPVRNLANAFFFTHPEEIGRRQIDEIIKTNPTLVVGVDFLFWFCYGNEAKTDEERGARFEAGLKLLERIPCPLIVGDIPDASSAVGGVLSEEEMPSPSAIYVANRRLKEWAVQHPQVTVVSLSSFMHSLMANEPLTLRGQTLSEIKTRKLLQSDKLHPTAQGSTLLALVVLDAFQSHQPNVPAEDIRWDSEQVYQMGFNATPTPAKNPAKPATEPAASAPAGK